MNTLFFKASRNIISQCGKLGCSLFVLYTSLATATPSISGGVWFNYRMQTDGSEQATDRDEETLGDVADEAFILYVNDSSENSPWSFQSELRVGPGSFTDTANNSTGDQVVLHKAWIGYQLNPTTQVQVGKSQVPFGWKTVNFWPGDMFQAGYGDQMDVGIKLTSRQAGYDYNLAYYHADDWGETSTDTVDDNRHWGSSSTFRKVQTIVADASKEFFDKQRFGASFQYGKLQDLSDDSAQVNGSHSAAAFYYHGQFEGVNTKLEYIWLERELPDFYRQSAALADKIENSRLIAELSYQQGPWLYYLDASWAFADTQGNEAGTIQAIAPGMSYDYGPGWVYAEYLTQDGYINRDGQVMEGDFSAFYISVDYYFN